MMLSRPGSLRFAAVFALTMVVGLGVAAALTGHAYPAGKRGFDVSWPNCGGSFPAKPYDFGIVGVTFGRAFTHNPCLADQFAWAEKARLPAALYTNLHAPVGKTGPRYSRNGPAGVCKKKDPVCKSYNYGANAAKDALDYAAAQGISAKSWWLDVETTNSWSKNTTLNGVVVKGAIEFLRANGIAAGIYSTAYQWGAIAGDYAPGLPVWVAGAPGLGKARSYCGEGSAFGGGNVALVQYPRRGFDGLYAC